MYYDLGNDVINIWLNTTAPATWAYNYTTPTHNYIHEIYTQATGDIQEWQNFIFTGTSCPPAVIAPTVSITSPSDSDTNNVNLTAIFIGDHASSSPLNCTLHVNRSVGNVTNTSITLGANTSLTANLNDSEGSYQWNVSCTDGVSTTYSANRVYILDHTSPSTNYSLTIETNISSYTDYLNVTINFTDNIKLYSINISDSEGFYVNLTNLNTTEYIYNLSINLDNYSIGTHTLEVWACDAHTANKIDDYILKLNKAKSEIKYLWNGDYVSISAKNPNLFKDIKSNKKVDRYNFDFIAIDESVLNIEKTYVVKSTKKISIIGDNLYPGWLVIHDLNKWIDFKDIFNNPAIVTRISDYEVEIITRGTEFNSIGDLNCYGETFEFVKNQTIDDCTNYETPFINWTLYKSPNFIESEKTFGDINVSFDCTSSANDITYVNNVSNVTSTQYCSNANPVNLTCNILTFYVADFTGEWTYTTSYNGLVLDNVTDLYNLTIPKLYLNFSNNTDIVVTDSTTSYFFNDTSLLIAMTNLSLGKVTVSFNNGSQFFDFENDDNTYYDRDLKVMEGKRDYVEIRVEDRGGSILSDASIEVFQLDKTTETERLVNVLYKNNEKSFLLETDEQYVFRAYLDDYVQENGFLVMKQGESEKQVIVMLYNTSYVSYAIYSNYGMFVPFDNYTSIDVTIDIDSLSEMTSAYVDWYIDDVYVQRDTMSGTGKTWNANSYTFTNTSTNLTAYVYINGELEETFYHQKLIKTNFADTESLLDSVRLSKLAFFIFVSFIILISVGVQSEMKNYGKEVFTGLCVVFAFINYYILAIAIITIIGLMSKKVLGDDT